MSLNLEDRKDLYSRAYVRAVAAAAGYIIGERDLDRDSVDLTISSAGFTHGVGGLTLDLQLKCTAAADFDGSYLKFRLGQKNHEDLRQTKIASPRLLVVVLVPATLAGWLDHSEDSLAVKNCGYWYSLRGQPALAARSTTLRIPRSNQFCVPALRRIMKNIARTGRP